MCSVDFKQTKKNQNRFLITQANSFCLYSNNVNREIYIYFTLVFMREILKQTIQVVHFLCNWHDDKSPFCKYAYINLSSKRPLMCAFFRCIMTCPTNNIIFWFIKFAIGILWFFFLSSMFLNGVSTFEFVHIQRI